MLRLVLFVISVNSVFAQEKFALKKDIREAWLQYDQNTYSPIGTEFTRDIQTIYFNIDAHEFSRDFLQIKSGDIFFVFVNGKLIKEYKGLLTLPIDSLAARYTTTLSISVHQRKINDRDLKTWIVTDVPLAAHTDTDLQKPDSSFKDFVILSGLMLMVLFVIMIRLNPKLASDYFSVTRIFSLREGDD